MSGVERHLAVFFLTAGGFTRPIPDWNWSGGVAPFPGGKGFVDRFPFGESSVTTGFLSGNRLVWRFITGRDGVSLHSLTRTEEDQADRAISKAQLHALLHFHMPPIDVVVFHGSRARPGFEGGFPLRCFQRLSRPHLATRLCRWRDNRSTRGASIPVLSY